MTSVDIVLDHYLWKKKIKNPKIYISKKLLKLNRLKLFKNKSSNKPYEIWIECSSVEGFCSSPILLPYLKIRAIASTARSSSGRFCK